MKQSNTLMALPLAVALIFLSLTGCKDRDKGDFVLGAVLAMTGDASKYGDQMKEGMDLAVEEINQHGGINGHPLKLVVEDCRADPKTAVSAFRKLTTFHQVPAVLSGISSVVVALAPVAAESKVVLLNCAAVTPKIEGANHYTFSDLPNAKQEGAFLAESVFSRYPQKKVAIFWLNNETGLALHDNFKDRLLKLGGQIVADETHEAGATDYRAQLLKIKSTEPDVICMPTWSKEFGLAIKQARELGLGCQFFSIAAMENPEMLNIAGSAAEGVLYSYYSLNENSPDATSRAFVGAYQKRYSRLPTVYNWTCYDGVYLVAEALRHGADTGEKMADFWLKMPVYKGATGELKFSPSGAVTTALRLKTVRNGKFAELPDKNGK